MQKKKLKPIKIPSARAEDQFVTRKMLWLVRDELKSDIRALDRKIGSIDSRGDSLESTIKQINVKLEEISVDNHRMHILLEEQNSNNRIVLEGLQALWQRQERIERHIGLPK